MNSCDFFNFLRVLLVAVGKEATCKIPIDPGSNPARDPLRQITTGFTVNLRFSREIRPPPPTVLVGGRGWQRPNRALPPRFFGLPPIVWLGGRLAGAWQRWITGPAQGANAPRSGWADIAVRHPEFFQSRAGSAPPL